MNQPASANRAGPFFWATVAALALSTSLAVYFLLGYRLALRFRPTSPTTVLKAAHFSASWPLARVAWLFAVVLGLLLLVRALARCARPPRRRRAVAVALLSVALVAVVLALFVSPARVQSPASARFGMVITDTGGYARAALLFALTAVLYASAAVAARRD